MVKRRARFSRSGRRAEVKKSAALYRKRYRRRLQLLSRNISRLQELSDIHRKRQAEQCLKSQSTCLHYTRTAQVIGFFKMPLAPQLQQGMRDFHRANGTEYDASSSTEPDDPPPIGEWAERLVGKRLISENETNDETVRPYCP